MPEGEKTLEDELRKAREEGRFQGEVLAKLNSVAETLKDMGSKHVTQDAVIANKVDRSDFNSLAAEVKELNKRVYIGVGIIIAIQVVIGIALS